MRIDEKKYKSVLHYLIEKCGGKPNFGKTVLWKLLYFSDFDFYELNESKLIGETYINIKYGPAPEHFNAMAEKLIKEEKIKKVPGKFGPYQQERFIALTEADLDVLSGEELEVINRAIDRYSAFSAIEIERLSHKDIPVEATEKGKPIDYDLVFYRETPFAVRSYEE